MKKSRFLISSLIMAGIAPVPRFDAVAQDGVSGGSGGESEEDAIIQRFAQEHQFLLAQHRSHASHASHGSHRSGSSGTVRSPAYTPPPSPPPRVTPLPSPSPSSRNTRSTPPSSVLPSSPATAPRSLYAAPTEDAITAVVRKVQLALKAYGYFNGPITGTVGPQTRAALVRFQTDYSLKVTGTITPEVLDAFHIVAQ